MKKVVVTGGAGFIGSNLVKALLDRKIPTFVIDNLSAGTLENIPQGAEFLKLDIRSPELGAAIKGADFIFHLAAKNCLADCAANPVETAVINVAGTAHLLQACVNNGIKDILYADTSAEYEGITSFPSRVDEVKPLSVYACSKRGAALMCEAFWELHGIRTTTVRYFNVYGPAQDWRRVIPPVMSAFTMKLLAKEAPTIYGTGEKRRDFIHVDDINSFHLLLLEKPAIRGGTYNLGSGEDHSILEIFEMIEAELKTGIRPVFKPDLPAEALRTLADISGTKATGWTPQVTLDNGIRSFIDYTKSRLAN